MRFGGDFLRRPPRGEYLTAASADRREPLRKFWQFAQASMHFPRQKLLSSMLGAMSAVVAQWPSVSGSESVNQDQKQWVRIRVSGSGAEAVNQDQS